MYSGTISSEELVRVLISCSPVSVDAQSVAAIIHEVLDSLDQHTVVILSACHQLVYLGLVSLDVRALHCVGVTGYIVETGTVVLSDPLSGGQADTDGDGVISLDEFVRVCCSATRTGI